MKGNDTLWSNYLTMFGNTLTAKHLGNEGGGYVCCDPVRSKFGNHRWHRKPLWSHVDNKRGKTKNSSSWPPMSLGRWRLAGGILPTVEEAVNCAAYHVSQKHMPATIENVIIGFGFKSFIDGGELRERDIFLQGKLVVQPHPGIRRLTSRRVEHYLRMSDPEHRKRTWSKCVFFDQGRWSSIVGNQTN